MSRCVLGVENDVTKDEAKTWMVENGLAENEFAASHIWEGLMLWDFEDEKQMELVRKYREWRKIRRNTKLCYAYTLAGLAIPKEYNADIS
jgi:hypothetical protein